MDTFTTNMLTEYGSPMYFFDEDYVIDRIAYLKSMLPKDAGICYAMKANTFLTKIASEAAERIEVCSPGEYLIVKKLGIAGEKLVISGVNKSEDNIDMIMTDLADKPVYTAESKVQFELLYKLAKLHNIKIKVIPRLTSNNQFGMKKQDIRDILNTNYKQYIEIIGIHFFSGTQKHSLKLIQKELNKVNKLMDALEEEYGLKLTEIEYGGGFPVHYFDEEEFDEEEFLKGFTTNYNELGCKRNLTIELGRSIVAGAGLYQTKIVDMKADEFANYCIVDGGINHITYYGQSMGMKLPPVKHIKHSIRIGDGANQSDDYVNYQVNNQVLASLDVNGLGLIKECEESSGEYVICGSLCTVNDILIKQIKLDNVSIGDLLLFEKAGAYCVTEGINLFLTRQLPGVVLYSKRNGRSTLVRTKMDTDFINCPNYNI